MPKIIIQGTVQGVGFRPTVYRVAKALGLKGHVLNTGSNVEVAINGNPNIFMDALKEALPPLARIDDYSVVDSPEPDNDFQIIQSSTGNRNSPLPPDAAICSDCLEELFQPENPRYQFPFINCTNCGARFSVISDMPYDRPKTSMDDFPMCMACQSEYGSPENRRFHAQTTSCPNCGPQFRLGSIASSDIGFRFDCSSDPIFDFTRQIDAGKIGAIKSWGGTHIVCIPEEIDYLRDKFNRSQKPLAVMVKDMKTARKYASISEPEESLLQSTARPIVLVDKKGDYLDATSPGLDKVGIYLPYNGLHHMLFDVLDHDAVIMTSGNLPGEPMAVTDEEISKLNADIFLIHNRRIINRVDDSVIIPYKSSQFFVRKSRGYVPEPLNLPHDRTLVAVGADMNGCGAISIGGKAIQTQHIGDINQYDTSLFLEHSIKHLLRLYGISRPDAVITDMHPRYSSRMVGKRLAEEWDVPVIEMQHHAAHGFALAAEHGFEKLQVLSCDGTGYGTDGQVWGGEILQIDKGIFERTGHLSYIPLLGGDKAVEDPRRMVFAITQILGTGQSYFDGQEADILGQIMDSSVKTSSTGRVLDALACWLGVCQKMTYDGEPAMKLEPYLRKGKASYDFKAKIENGVIDTVDLFGQLGEIAGPGKSPDAANLSRSFVEALFEGLIEAASPSESLGFTGGVSYNITINEILEQKLDKRGIKLITHQKVPNGDGGISFGQLAGGGYRVSSSSR